MAPSLLRLHVFKFRENSGELCVKALLCCFYVAHCLPAEISRHPNKILVNWVINDFKVFCGRKFRSEQSFQMAVGSRGNRFN